MTALLPFEPWVSGTNQNSVPANNNAIRAEVLAARVISDTITAQPGSPTECDLYIIPDSATGAQWSTFAVGSLAYFKGGTWYEFAPYNGLLKVVGSTLKRYDGAVWQADAAAGFPNPMTTTGDLIIGGTAGAAQRLGVGANGQVLKVVAGAPAWAPEAGGGTAAFNPLLLNVMSGFIMPGGTQYLTLNASSPLSQGSASLFQPNLVGTDVFGALSRVRHLGSSGANSIGAYYTSVAYAARHRGFSVVMMGGPSSGLVSTSRYWMGLRVATGAFATGEPSTYVDSIGIGFDSTDSNYQLMHNDSSGTATKIDLGASFPRATTSNTDVYRLELSCDAGGNINYTVRRMNSPTAVASGTLATKIPDVTAQLCFGGMHQAGGTTSACEVYNFGIYFTAPY